MLLTHKHSKDSLLQPAKYIKTLLEMKMLIFSIFDVYDSWVFIKKFIGLWYNMRKLEVTGRVEM